VIWECDVEGKPEAVRARLAKIYASDGVA
jgi:hypothetical protein